MVGVESCDDVIVGLSLATVLENSNVSILGKCLAKTLRQLDGPMMRIIVTYKTAHESDHDGTGARRID